MNLVLSALEIINIYQRNIQLFQLSPPGRFRTKTYPSIGRDV